MKNNRQYESMREAARQKIKDADPVWLSALTGFHWNATAFETQTLGIPIRISFPECRITPELDMWHDLTILQYLANTKGAPLTGKYITLNGFCSGGLARGTSFDRENASAIARLGEHSEQMIRDAAINCGGMELHEKSDLTFLFSFLPGVPIKLNMWLADEDFPASGKVLFDSSADQDLQVEAAGTAAGILLTLLERTISG